MAISDFPAKCNHGLQPRQKKTIGYNCWPIHCVDICCNPVLCRQGQHIVLLFLFFFHLLLLRSSTTIMTIHDHDHHYYKLQPSPSQTKPETSLLYIIVASPSRVIDGHLGIRVLKKHSSIWHRMVAESEGPTTRQRVIQHWTLWQQVAFFNLFTLMDLFDGVFFQLSVISSVGISSDHKPQTVVTNY